jgi:hypothetical protein
MPGLENLLAGKTLVKRYRIEEVIGLGGFAAVYRAADERLGRDVAVKVITLVPPEPEQRERLGQRFEREARAAAALPHHPNVVTVHDFGTDPELGVDFLVMELLKGETAAQLFKREGKPATDVALQILREAAEGIGVGHAAGIIHRDVKPGNIFLAEPHDDDPFRVVVLDFGIARIATDDSELTRTLAGENPLTAAYASPEQMRGDHALTAAADVFSLGVVGYQLLTGEKPFGAGEGRRLRGRDPVRPIHELNADVAPGIEAVIAKAMAEEPSERYPDANAFGEALDRAMAADDRTVIAPAAAAGAGALAGAAAADDRTVLHPGVPAAASVPAAAAAAAVPHPSEYGGARATVPARRSKMPAVLGGLLVLALLAAVAVFGMSHGKAKTSGTSAARSDTAAASTTGGGDSSSGGPEVLAPPLPGGDSTSGGATTGTGGRTDANAGAAPSAAPAAPPIVRTPGIAPSPAPAPSPVQAPVVTRPSAPPASPAPAPRPSAPPSRPQPQPSNPQPTAPTPAPQPAPQAPPPSPPPAPPPPPPPPPAPTTPSNPPPRDTILIPTPTPPAPPPSPSGGTPPGR